jgi:hypothetical protein
MNLLSGDKSNENDNGDRGYSGMDTSISVKEAEK